MNDLSADLSWSSDHFDKYLLVKDKERLRKAEKGVETTVRITAK